MAPILTGKIQFIDPDTGKPLAFGSVATYDNNRMPKITFSDLAQNNENNNPVPLDGSGSAFFYGSGAYIFDAYNSVGVLKNTIEMGVEQEGSSIPSSESTLDLTIGDSNNQFNSDSEQIIYKDDVTVKGKATVKQVVIAGQVGAGSLAGTYDEVMAALENTPKPDYLSVIDPPPSGYDPKSSRIYQLVAAGNSAEDPANDTASSQSGQGENWTDILKLSFTEEMRLKRGIMLWDLCKDIISSGTLLYPIMVWGSDGVLYKTTGAPTATQIQTTDPTIDTLHAVWTYVYDPTETALFPPWYRSPNTGIDWNSTTSVAIPPQAQKLLNSSSAFVDDGETTATYYKSVSAWQYGAGTSGTPKGGAGAGGGFAADGYYEVHMIKTTSGVEDFVIIGGAVTMAMALSYINGLAGEIAAGRTWYANRRVGTFGFNTGAMVKWQRSGSEYQLTDPTDDLTWTGNKATVAQAMKGPPLMKVRASITITACTGVGTDAAAVPTIKLTGYNQNAGGYTADFEGLFTSPSGIAAKTRGGFEFVRQLNATSQIYLTVTDAALFSFALKTTSYIDALTD